MSIIQAVQASIQGQAGPPPPPPTVGSYFFQGSNQSYLLQSNPTPANQPVIFPNGDSSSALTFNNTWSVTQALGLCNDIEIDLWIYPTANNCIIVTEQDSTTENTGYTYAMIEIDSANCIRARSWPQSGNNAIISAPITLNAWHHIYFHHIAGQAYLEVDGVLSGTDSYSRAAPGNTYIGIGTFSVTAITTTNRYQGRIDTLQIRSVNFIGSSWAGSNLTYRPSIQFELDANNPGAYDINNPTVWSDTSGAGRNCALYGSPTYVPDGSATGTPAAYFTFDRNSLQYGQIPNIPGMNRWTVEAVYRISEPYTSIRATSVVTTVFDLANGGPITYGYVNYCIGTNGNQEFTANWVGQYFDGGVWRTTNGIVPSYTNTWYHVIVTYDGQNLRVYKNGLEQGSASLTTAPSTDGGGPVRIARRWDGYDNQSDNYFPGDIGFVRLWYGAMSPGDVSKQYDQAVTRGYPQI